MNLMIKMFLYLVVCQMQMVMPASGQDLPTDKVPDNVVMIPSPGLTFIEPNKIIFNVEVKEGFFSYLDKFSLEIEGLTITSLDFDPVVTFFDQTFKKNKQGLKNLASGTALFEISNKAIVFKESQTLNVKLLYQACTEEYCLFPAEANLTQTLKSSDAVLLNNLKNPTWMNGSFLYALFFVFLAGFLTSLTPCVYPLIPITIAVLGRQKADTKTKGFIKSTVYVLGMSLTYSALGLLAATSGFMFGSLLSNIYFLGFLSLIFFVAALSMYDVFEIKSPQFLAKYNNNPNKSYLGIFVSGAFSGLVVGPCVGPVLIGILSYISTSKDILIGFSLMFMFAIGLGSLIIVLGTFSNLMQKIPRSGQWMNYVKKSLSLVFLIMIGYFLKPIIDTQNLFIVLSLIFALFSFIIIYKSSTSNPSFEISFFKAIFISAIMVAVFSGLISKERFDRFVGYSSSTYADSNWDVFSDEALTKATQNNQIVILDFYADWCAACKELKHKTFADSKVLNFSKNIKWLYFDATKSSKALDQYKQRFGILGLPTILFFNSKGELRKDLTLTGYEGPEDFISRLTKIEEL